MLRLNDIVEQRKRYSSVDDIPYAHDSDSEFDEPDQKHKQVQGITLARQVATPIDFPPSGPGLR